MIEWYYPLLAWAAVLAAMARGLQVLFGDRGPRWLPLLVGVVAWIPVAGLPIARWLHGFNSNLSIPLVAILLNASLSPFCGRRWLDERALRAGLWFGASAGVILYPMAAGFGAFDPYGLGWHWPGIELVVGGLAVMLLWRGNAFGWVLLVTGVAWRMECMESQNVWDYLVDPVYFILSLIGLVAPRRRIAIVDRVSSDPDLSEGTAVPQP
ncbi:MAG: hypothetical protein DWH81_01480 [Planctomycetota bacterium]|nr:MAG: hypothetical protein DWH81_01480 [Planctomycetota bacterium]